MTCLHFCVTELCWRDPTGKGLLIELMGLVKKLLLKVNGISFLSLILAVHNIAIVSRSDDSVVPPRSRHITLSTQMLLLMLILLKYATLSRIAPLPER